MSSSARLLRLLSLLQARRFWTGAELAERLEITERTVRRDMDRLRGLGYPVESSSGIAGGYQLGAGSALPPLLLEEDEALAVSLGLRAAAAGTVSGMEEISMRALAKLEQVLPQRVRRRVREFHATIQSLAPLGPHIDAETLIVLASASRNAEQLVFEYEKPHSPPESRHVEPHGLVHSQGRWYLVAWDLIREDFRTFRVDRLSSPRSTGRRFTPRTIPHGTALAYIAQSIATDPYLYRARIVLHTPLREVAAQVSPLAGRLEPIDARHCLLTTGGNDLETLALHVALLGVEFEVLDPPELRGHLRALVGRLQRAAQTAPTTRRVKRSVSQSRSQKKTSTKRR